MNNKKSTDPQRYGPDAHTNIMLFPESWIALSEEVAHPAHAVLRTQLDIDALFAQCSFSTNIACICTYVNVVVDGEYDMEAFDRLFKVVVQRLRRKRGMIDEIGKELIIL